MWRPIGTGDWGGTGRGTGLLVWGAHLGAAHNLAAGADVVGGGVVYLLRPLRRHQHLRQQVDLLLPPAEQQVRATCARADSSSATDSLSSV